MGPWCDMDQSRTLSSRAVRLEPGRKPNSTSCRASHLPGVEQPYHATTVGTKHSAGHGDHLASSEGTNESMPRRAVKPVALRRALLRRRCRQLPTTRRALWVLPERPDTRKSSFPRTCAHVAGWLGSTGKGRGQGRARSRRLAAGVQESKSHRCPDAVSQNQHAQSSEQVAARLAECLAAQMMGGARCSRTTSLQAAAAKSLPAWSSAETIQPAPHREWCAP